jgi:hypothetical protein
MTRAYVNPRDPFTPSPEELELFEDAFPGEGWLTWTQGHPIPGGLDNTGAQLLLGILTHPPLPHSDILHQPLDSLNDLEQSYARASKRCRELRTTIKNTSDPTKLSELQAKLSAAEEHYSEITFTYKQWRRQQRLRYKNYITTSPTDPSSQDPDDLSDYDIDRAYQSFSEPLELNTVLD